jgi:tetratricopeptide (TPR) repeat protein
MEMQGSQSRATNTASDPGLPAQRAALPYAVASFFRSRRKVTAIFVILALGCIALLCLLDPWRRRGGSPETTFSENWQEALRATKARDLQIAQTQLNRCLDACPLNAEAHFLLARTCRQSDNYAGWLDHLQIAAILGWPQDHVRLEVLLKEAQAGNIWRVQEELQRYLVSSPPEEVLIVEALVKGYLENEKPLDAFRLAEQWIKNYPDDWLGWLYHGRTHHYVFLYGNAVADYEKVLELKPGQPQAQFWLAETFLSKGQFDRAMELYRAYLESHPSDADALLKLAKCQSYLGDRENARATLDELLRKYSNHTAGLFARAKVEQAAPEKALPWLRRAEATAPNHPDILQMLYQTLRALHMDKEADQCEQRFKDCHAKVNQMVDLKIQLVKKQDSVELRYRLAVLNLEMGLGYEEEAAHLFQTVLYIDPDHRPTLRALADYWAKHGDPRRAADYRDRADGRRPQISFQRN